MTKSKFKSADSVTNRLQSKGFDIQLTETNWNPEKVKNLMPEDKIEKNPVVSNQESTDAYIFLKVIMACSTALLEDENGNILAQKEQIPLYKFVVDGNPNPAHDLEQNVHNGWKLVETSSEANIVTYVYAYANGDTMPPSNFTYHAGTFEEPKAIGWILIENSSSATSHTYIFGYNQKLSPKDKTVTLFDKVKLKNFINGEIKGEVTIDRDATQHGKLKVENLLTKNLQKP